MKVCMWAVFGALAVMPSASIGQVNLAGVGSAGNLRVGSFDGASVTDVAAHGLGESTIVAVGHFLAMSSFDVIVSRNGRFHRWSFNSAGERFSVLNMCNAPEEFTKSVGVGDFDGDGNNGFVMQNPNGRCASFEVDNVSGDFTYRLALGVPGNANFTNAVGVADVNDDGAFDIVVQDPATRRVRYRLYNGTERQELSEVLRDGAGQVFAPDGTVVGAARVNGYLYLFVDPTNAEAKVRILQMNGTSVASSTVLAGWKVARSLSAVGN